MESSEHRRRPTLRAVLQALPVPFKLVNLALMFVVVIDIVVIGLRWERAGNILAAASGALLMLDASLSTVYFDQLNSIDTHLNGRDRRTRGRIAIGLLFSIGALLMVLALTGSIRWA